MRRTVAYFAAPLAIHPVLSLFRGSIRRPDVPFATSGLAKRKPVSGGIR